MDCHRCLVPLVCAGVTVLLLIASSGCAVRSSQVVVSPGAVDRRCLTSDLAVVPGCRCVADAEYHPTVWFPLAPGCLRVADPAEGAVIPSPDTSPEAVPTPRLAPPEIDSGQQPAAGGDENPVLQTSDQQDVLLVVPEPSLQEPPAPTDFRPGEGHSSSGSQTAG